MALTYDVKKLSASGTDATDILTVDDNKTAVCYGVMIAHTRTADDNDVVLDVYVTDKDANKFYVVKQCTVSKGTNLVLAGNELKITLLEKEKLSIQLADADDKADVIVTQMVEG